MAAVDITGIRFGKLVAVRRVSEFGKSRWMCKCDCGNDADVLADQLKSGKTSSCGCLRSENAKKQSSANSLNKKSREAIAARILKNSIPEPNSGCWLWAGSVDKRGYGHTAMGAGKTMIASRLSFYAFCEDPEGMIVMHKCDNRVCVNPDHLMIGTQKDNIADMFAKGRARPRGKSVPAR